MNNLGWKCPICHKCYAPSIRECKNCNLTHLPVTITSNIPGMTTIPHAAQLPYIGTLMEKNILIDISKAMGFGVTKTQSYAEMMGITITNKLWPQNAHSIDTNLTDR